MGNWYFLSIFLLYIYVRKLFFIIFALFCFSELFVSCSFFSFLEESHKLVFTLPEQEMCWQDGSGFELVRQLIIKEGGAVFGPSGLGFSVGSGVSGEFCFDRVSLGPGFSRGWPAGEIVAGEGATGVSADSVNDRLAYGPSCKSGKNLFSLKYWLVKVRGADFFYQFKIDASQKTFSLELPENKLFSVLAYPVFELETKTEEKNGEPFLDGEKEPDDAKETNGEKVLNGEKEPDDAKEPSGTKKEKRSKWARAAKEIEGFFYPAGCIYPYSENLSWLQGFSSTLLYDFYYHSKYSGNSGELSEDFANCFNWKKLCDELEKKALTVSNSQSEATDLPDKLTAPVFNPWLLDSTEILSSIENTSFSVNLLKVKKKKTFSRDDIVQGFLSELLKSGILSANIGEKENMAPAENSSALAENYSLLAAEEESKSEKNYYLLSPYFPENMNGSKTFERVFSSESYFLLFFESSAGGNPAFSEESLNLGLEAYRACVKIDSSGKGNFFCAGFL